MEKATNHTIDRIDRKLMRALQRDNAEAISDLAERCGLSRSACSRRISRLEKLGFIKKHVALLDQEKLGLGLTVFVMIKTNQHNAGWSQKFQNVLDELTGVIEAHRMGGEVDYLLKAVVADMAGYDSLYKKLITADLFDVSASFVMETMKNTTELPLS